MASLRPEVFQEISLTSAAILKIGLETASNLLGPLSPESRPQTHLVLGANYTPTDQWIVGLNH